MVNFVYTDIRDVRVLTDSSSITTLLIFPDQIALD